MSFQALSFALAVGVLAATPGAAAAQTPHQHDSNCCQPAASKAACCASPRVAIANQPVVNRLEPTGRQTMTVWFHRPVKIGDRILMGQYVIEHDAVRMARGRPCTHIYAASDRRLPVVAFHCTHLNRVRAERSTVVLRSLGEPNGMAAFAEFQFAGDDAGHGVPAGR